MLFALSLTMHTTTMGHDHAASHLRNPFVATDLATQAQNNLGARSIASAVDVAVPAPHRDLARARVSALPQLQTS